LSEPRLAFGTMRLTGDGLWVDPALAGAASGLGLTAVQAALAWIRAAAPGATPIVGLTSEAELAEALGVPDQPLPTAALEALLETQP